MTQQMMAEQPGLAPDETEDSATETPQNEQVKKWASTIRQAKLNPKIKDAFERMRRDMKFARGLQWPDQENLDDERYVANLVQRHLRQREAALYAKNPTAVAKRRHTLDFTLWDGSPESLMQAQQAQMMGMQAQQLLMQAQATGQQIPQMQMQSLAQSMQQAQQAAELLQDHAEGMQRRQQLDKIAKTLEIVWEHQTGEQQPPFKGSMKHLVRRALTTGVGYLKLGYHRFQEYRAEDIARVTDLTEQIAALQTAMAESQDDENSSYDEQSAELAEAQDLLRKVTGEEESFMREGLDFDFPRATSVIVDPACYQLDGFLGARWVAHEWLLTPSQVQDVYGVDIKREYRHYNDEGQELGDEAKAAAYESTAEPDTKAQVWEIWDKHTGQVSTIVDGHPDYVREPDTPAVYLERFWPFFVLTFNGLEDEEEIFPPSDVTLIWHMQKEMNLMRQRLREHRDASRPGHVASKGKLDGPDKQRLENRRAHEVIELNQLSEQDDIRRVLQPVPTSPIDPNQYEVGSTQDDIYKVVGSQEAVMGGTSGATATEASIGESSRLSAIGSAVDDLDDFLTSVAKFSSHLLLAEMSREKVLEIAGRGAVWPELSGAEVAKDLWLEIRAGSSGRPNKAAEIQNMERVMPFLLQIPGVKPDKLLNEMLERLDDRLNLEDFYDPNLPSVMAMNSQTQVGTGDPSTDPNQQGSRGGEPGTVAQGDSNLGPRPPAENRNMDPNMNT